MANLTCNDFPRIPSKFGKIGDGTQREVARISCLKAAFSSSTGLCLQRLSDMLSITHSSRPR